MLWLPAFGVGDDASRKGAGNEGVGSERTAQANGWGGYISPAVCVASAPVCDAVQI